MPGAISVSTEAAGAQLEHAALGDVEHLLAAAQRVGAGERAVLDGRRRTCGAAPSRAMRRPPSATRDVARARRNVPANTTFFALWLMLMKPPAPARRGPNFETLTLPSASACGEAEHRDVEPAAVVEVELVRLVDDRLRVDRGAEVQAAGRDAADHAGLGGEREQVVRCLSSAATAATPSGMPMPRLTTLFGAQLHRGAPRDHLAHVERRRLEACRPAPASRRR